MFVDEWLMAPGDLNPARLAARFTLYDDGWRCGLDLRPGHDGREIAASFRSYDRTRGDYEARVTLDVTTGALQLVVFDFNELDRQEYDGFVSRSGAVTICGTTVWDGDRFGFFAIRRPPHQIGVDILRPPTLDDLRGSFVLSVDGSTAVLVVDDVDGGVGRGRVWDPAGSAVDGPPGAGLPLELTVRPAPDDRRRFDFVVERAGGEPAAMSAWMFDRRHDALAGWVEIGPRRLGCYLVRTDATVTPA